MASTTLSNLPGVEGMGTDVNSWEIYEVAFEKSNILMDAIHAYQGSANVAVVAALGWIVTSSSARSLLAKSRSIRWLLQGAVPVFFLMVSMTLLQMAMALNVLYEEMFDMGQVLLQELRPEEEGRKRLANALTSRLPPEAFMGYTAFNLLTFGILFCVLRSCGREDVE